MLREEVRGILELLEAKLPRVYWLSVEGEEAIQLFRQWLSTKHFPWEFVTSTGRHSDLGSQDYHGWQEIWLSLCAYAACHPCHNILLPVISV